MNVAIAIALSVIVTAGAMRYATAPVQPAGCPIVSSDPGSDAAARRVLGGAVPNESQGGSIKWYKP